MKHNKEIYGSNIFEYDNGDEDYRDDDGDDNE